MKQLILILMISALTALAGGCDKKSGERHYRIGVSQCSTDDWRNKMNEELEREILFHPEAELEIRSADDSNDRQIADIQYFIDNNFDIIIAAPNEAEAITPIIKKAYEKGIPVVLFDRNINGNTFTAWQGPDNYGIGGEAAKYAARLYHENPGNGKIIEIYGLPGSTPAIDRHNGFSHAIPSYPGLEIVATGVGKWNYDSALRCSDSLLRMHPDAQFIYAHNDRMAIAAAESARKLGLSPKIIGIDAAPEIGIKAVRDSVIDATFIYPTEGHRLIRTAIKILNGEPYDTVVNIPSSSAVDYSNADILLLQNSALEEDTSKMRKLKSQVDDYWNRHSAQTVLFYAAIAILFLFSVLLFFIIRMYWLSKRHQSELLEQNRLLGEERDKQTYLNNELQIATQSKLLFFTNVSHDLRTPLTLISEPILQLRDASNLTDAQRSLVRLADKNVRILQRLINQILDFRKYENGKLDLHPAPLDLGEALGDWSDSFRTLAGKRDIRLITNLPKHGDLIAELDPEKIERVVFNLLSNAFKHTPPKGTVAISCSLSEEMIEITVSDTGEGIPREDLSRIFDRFYQVDKIHPNGSGIGLSLVKAFVELHGGSISVESEPHKSTVFTVKLPYRKSEIPASVAAAPKEAATPKDILPEVDNVEIQRKEFDPDKPLLLLVEDNADMRTLIHGILSDDYNISMVSNGKEGLKSAIKYVPDIVISDVMMPVMDGLEFCNKLKNEVTTSHIPVLLLTACNLDEQRMQGYASGADAYLPKPFNADLLKTRCRNLLDNRRRVKDIWRNSPSASGATAPATVSEKTTDKGKSGRSSSPAENKNNELRSRALSEIDNDFYHNFISKVEKSMGDPDLSVDQLAAEMGLGRSQFYRKIKALTNYSPVELLRKMRLQRARDLLLKTDKSVSEIAYEVGFSTPAYFTRCFREAYGKTPSELRDSL